MHLRSAARTHWDFLYMHFLKLNICGVLYGAGEIMQKNLSYTKKISKTVKISLSHMQFVTFCIQIFEINFQQCIIHVYSRVT